MNPNWNWAGILITAIAILAVFAIVLAAIPVPQSWTDPLNGIAGNITAPRILSGGAHPTSLLASWWSGFTDSLNLNPIRWFKLW